MLSRPVSVRQRGARALSRARTADAPGVSALCGRAATPPRPARCRSLEGAVDDCQVLRAFCKMAAHRTPQVVIGCRREVGATLHVVTADGEPASHNSALQWFRQVAGVPELEVIAGAVRCQARPPQTVVAPEFIMALLLVDSPC